MGVGADFYFVALQKGCKTKNRGGGRNNPTTLEAVELSKVINQRGTWGSNDLQLDEDSGTEGKGSVVFLPLYQRTKSRSGPEKDRLGPETGRGFRGRLVCFMTHSKRGASLVPSFTRR